MGRGGGRKEGRGEGERGGEGGQLTRAGWVMILDDDARVLEPLYIAAASWSVDR